MRKTLRSFLKKGFGIARNAYYSIIDVFEGLFGMRDELTPPRRMIFIGNGDFKKTGQEFLEYFIKLGHLKPDDRVLDVGCGIGRMAVPLTKYLSSEGRYEGFDIVPAGINWCNTKINPKFPNFKFQIADVHSERYYPKGRYKASEYKFPFANNSFDFIFLTSVFTHMLPDDMENYLSEISRVLDKNGRSLLTFFLINEESRDCINKKKSIWDFKHQYDPNSCVVDPDIPESAIAFKQSFIEGLLTKHSLKIESIHYGSWCGRTEYLSFQDILIVGKL